MLLGLVLGNSSLRHGLLERERVVDSASIPVSDLPARARDLDRWVGPRAARETVVASVRDDLLPVLEACLPRRYLPFTVARRDFPLPIESSYGRPEDVGTDRLLGAIAAARRAKGRGAVVVDFGTAVTVGAVSPAGVFLGGAIAAGQRPLASGVAARLPRLPAVDLGGGAAGSGRGGAPVPFLARDTETALRSGLYWQVAGGARALLVGALRDLTFDPLVLATGGDADLFAPAVPEIHEIVPDLVLEGLAIACSLRP